MATNDNILSGDDIALLARETGLPNSEWNTPGADPDAFAPIIGGTWAQHYPRPKGIKKLGLFRTKAGLAGSPPATITDQAHADALYGTTALRLSANAAGTTVVLSATGGTSGVMPAVDITQGSVRGWVRMGPNFFDGRYGGNFRLRLYSSGSPASPSTDYTEFDLGFRSGQFKARNSTDWGPWQPFTISGPMASIASDSLKGVVKSGSGATATAVTYAAWVLPSNTTNGGTSVEFGDIEFIPNPRTKGAVIFTFDDSRLDTFTNAARIMSMYGFPGCIMTGAPALEIGAANRLTVKQVRMAQDVLGWQIASQSWNTEDLATVRAMTPEQRTAFYAKIRAWHAANGFRGGMDGSWYTGVSQSELDMLPAARQHFRTMRSYGGPAPAGQPVMQFGESAPLSDPMCYVAVEFDASRFQVANAYANDIKSYVDMAASNKGAAIFVTHNAFEAGRTQNIQNLTDMCADVYSRSDVEWLTIDEYVRSYS